LAEHEVSTEVRAVLGGLSVAERDALNAVWELTHHPLDYVEGLARFYAAQQTGVSVERIAQIRGQLSAAVRACKKRIAREQGAKDAAQGTAQ